MPLDRLFSLRKRKRRTEEERSRSPPSTRLRPNQSQGGETISFNFSRSFRIIAKRTWFQAGAIPSIGLTKLYEPEDAASAIADVVFVHGLTGGAHTTWLHRRGAQQVYWPSDLLPKDCPNTRILTFGYDANVTQFWGPASSSRVNNHAESLLGSLSRLRARTDTEHRPVIFVAHSLGGLVTQYALSISRTSPEPDIALLETHTQGIAFLGTPHHGSDYAAWGTLASDLTRWLKRTNRDIIAVLQPQSEILATIQKGFQRLLSVRQSSNHRIAVTCFYEELPVTGISEIVPKHSAILPAFPSYGIHANHMDMTKFDSGENAGYEAISGELFKWLKAISSGGPQATVFPSRGQIQMYEWLSPSKYMSYDRHHNYESSEIVSGTGEWLFSDPLFHAWKDGISDPILWLHGASGVGKTKLCALVIDDALTDFKNGTGPRPLFFYCSRHVSETPRSQPESILRCLIRQILETNPKESDTSAIDRLYTSSNEGRSPCDTTIRESQALILDLVCPQDQYLIFIDALDECDPDSRVQFVQALKAIVDQAPNQFRVFLTSRNEPDLSWLLAKFPNIQVTSEKNGKDIFRFVSQTLQNMIQNEGFLRRVDDQDEFASDIDGLISTAANGIFRWAALQLINIKKFLRKAEIWDQLGRFPPDLAITYGHIYDDFSAIRSENDCLFRKRLFTWLLYAKSPLDLHWFKLALTLNSVLQADDVKPEHVLEDFANFISFDETRGQFRFSHQSVRKFLLQHPDYKSDQAHGLLAETCLLTLISTSSSPGAASFLSANSNVLPRGLHDLDEGLNEYATKVWLAHCSEAAGNRSNGTLKQAMDFFFFDDSAVRGLSPFALWMRKDGGLDMCFSYDIERDGNWPDRQSEETITALQDTTSRPLELAFLCSCRMGFCEIVSQIHKHGSISRLTIESGIQAATECDQQAVFTLLLSYIRSGYLGDRIILQAIAQDDTKLGYLEGLLPFTRNRAITGGPLLTTAINTNSRKALKLLIRKIKDDLILPRILERAVRNGSLPLVECLLEHSKRMLEPLRVLDCAMSRRLDDVNDKKERAMFLERVLSLCNDKALDDDCFFKCATEKLCLLKRFLLYETPALVDCLLQRRQRTWKPVDLFDYSMTRLSRVHTSASENDDNDAIMIFQSILRLYGTEALDDTFLVEGAAKYSVPAMRCLIDNCHVTIVPSTEMMKSATSHPAQVKQMIEFLLEQGGSMTPLILDRIFTNCKLEPGLLTFLEDLTGKQMPTSNVLNKIASVESVEVVAELLGRGAELEISTLTVEAAIQNKIHGAEVLELLLSQSQIPITEPILLSALHASAPESHLEALLQHADPCEISQAVLEATVEHPHLMIAMLEKTSGNIIEEDVLLASVDEDGSTAMLEVLISSSKELQITEDLIIKTLQLTIPDDTFGALLDLFDMPKENSDYFVAAADNLHGWEMLEMLFDRYVFSGNPDDLLASAASDPLNVPIVMDILTDKFGSFTITDEGLERSLETGEYYATRTFLIRREDHIPIPQSVIETAAEHAIENSNNLNQFHLILDRIQVHQVTETVILALFKRLRSKTYTWLNLDDTLRAIEIILQVIRPTPVIARTILRAATKIPARESCAPITVLLAHLCKVKLEAEIFEECNQEMDTLLKRMNLVVGEEIVTKAAQDHPASVRFTPSQTTAPGSLSITLQQLATKLGIIASSAIFDFDMISTIEEAEDSLCCVAKSIEDGVTPI